MAPRSRLASPGRGRHGFPIRGPRREARIRELEEGALILNRQSHRRSRLILPMLTTAGDLVRGEFTRDATRQPRVTDITERPTQP